MSQKSGNCWACGESLQEADYGRQMTCPKCRRDTHSCKNCIHRDTSYNNECKENQADRVVEKEKANFCDYFLARSGAGAGMPTQDQLKSAAEALFGKKS